MTLHEQSERAEIVRQQIALLNETIGLLNHFPTIEVQRELAQEILRLSKLIS